MITEEDLGRIAKGLGDIKVMRSRMDIDTHEVRTGEHQGMMYAWEIVSALAGDLRAHVRLHHWRIDAACLDSALCGRCDARHCVVWEGACVWQAAIMPLRTALRWRRGRSVGG